MDIVIANNKPEHRPDALQSDSSRMQSAATFLVETSSCSVGVSRSSAARPAKEATRPTHPDWKVCYIKDGVRESEIQFKAPNKAK